MARDLIPPPSPAGRPTPEGTFSESELLRSDAERDAAAALLEPEAVEPAPESQYRSRFGFITGALVGLGIAAMVIVGLVVAGGNSVKEPPWSAWKPKEKERDVRLIEIARHVAPQYRLNSGDQLVNVEAQPLEIDGSPLSVVIRSAGEGEGADIINIPGKSVLFVLKGLGPRGSIASEEPSEKRLRLLQRQAYELALYAFTYVEDVDSVVAFLPPPPPATPAVAAPSATATATPTRIPTPAIGDAAATATEGQPLPAMLFLPGDLEAALKRPLVTTLPPEPPRPSTMSDAEARQFRAFAQLHSFNAAIVTDQTGAGALVLDRLSSSPAARESLLSTLKA